MARLVGRLLLEGLEYLVELHATVLATPDRPTGTRSDVDHGTKSEPLGSFPPTSRPVPAAAPLRCSPTPRLAQATTTLTSPGTGRGGGDQATVTTPKESRRSDAGRRSGR